MKTNIFILLLIAVFAIHGCRDSSVTTKEPLPSHCNDSLRYEKETEGGGIGLRSDQAMAAIERYREGNPDAMTGFHLSKRALDQMFAANPNANGIWIDLIDTKDIPEYDSDSRITVVVSVKQNPHSRITTDIGRDAFISARGCPNMCERF